MNAPAKLAKPARRYAVRDALAPGLTWRGLVERAGPRPWLIRGLLMLAAVSLITGKGGVGKSIKISLAIAMHYAAEIDLRSVVASHVEGERPASEAQGPHPRRRGHRGRDAPAHGRHRRALASTSAPSPAGSRS